MTTTTNVKDQARIFITDYASYNNGTQFEFGHWVNLDQFNDADELKDYIDDHFAEADEVSPLDSPREEIMITDFEGFPEYFYSESSMNFEALFDFFEFMELEGIESLENENDNLLSLWNDYAIENCPDDQIFYFDDETLILLFGNDPMKAFQAGLHASINWGDDYLILDGYGNIKSITDPSTEIDETVLIDWILENKI